MWQMTVFTRRASSSSLHDTVRDDASDHVSADARYLRELIWPELALFPWQRARIHMCARGH